MKISGQAEGWWTLTPMTAKYLHRRWSGPTFSPSVFAGELNTNDSHWWRERWRDDVCFHYLLHDAFLWLFLEITGELKHQLFSSFCWFGISGPFPFFFQKDRFYRATIFQASSGFVFRSTNPQPQRPPKQPNYQDFLAMRRIFRERKNIAKNMYQKVCDWIPVFFFRFLMIGLTCFFVKKW